MGSNPTRSSIFMAKTKTSKTEPEANIRVTRCCSNCGDALKPDQQYANKPLQFFVGKYVKIKFTATSGDREYMWVAVAEIDGDNLKGTLNNDPVVCTNLKDGDPVILKRDQIIEVL